MEEKKVEEEEEEVVKINVLLIMILDVYGLQMSGDSTRPTNGRGCLQEITRQVFWWLVGQCVLKIKEDKANPRSLSLLLFKI